MRIFCFLCVFLTLSFALGCSDKPTQGNDGPMGFIKVVSGTTSPQDYVSKINGYIRLDGKETGQMTPHTFRVDAGNHEIAVHLPLYRTYTESRYVRENDTTFVTVWLLVEPSILHITTIPPEAKVVIRNEYQGTTPYDLTGLTDYTYSYNIWLKLQGYFPFVDQFKTDTLLSDYYWNILMDPCPNYSFLFIRNNHLCRSDLSGAEVAYLTTHPDVIKTTLCWTDNRTKLAYATNTEIVVLSSDGVITKSIPVSSSDRANDISWSHDGRYLVWGQYTSGIWRYDSSTDEVLRILQTVGFLYDHNPVFSPDDQWIAYCNHRWESYCIIRLLKADGSEGRDLTPTFRTTYDQYLNLTWANNNIILFADKQLNISQSDVVEPVDMDFGGTIIGVSPDGTQLAYAKEGKTHLVDIASWTETTSIDVPAGYNSVVWVQEHQALMSFTGSYIYWVTPTKKVYKIFGDQYGFN